MVYAVDLGFVEGISFWQTSQTNGARRVHLHALCRIDIRIEMSSPEASFHTALEMSRCSPTSESSASAQTSTSSPESTSDEDEAEYRAARPLPHELRDHCKIYFEEGLCTVLEPDSRNLRLSPR